MTLVLESHLESVYQHLQGIGEQLVFLDLYPHL